VRRVLQHGIHVERGAPNLLRGLGNVAGDLLKAASDLGVPVVGVVSFINKAISASTAIAMAFSKRFILSTIPDNCPSKARFAAQLASSCAFRCICRRRHFGYAHGKLLWQNQTAFAGHQRPRQSTYASLYYQSVVWGGPELRLQQEMVLGLAGWRLLYALGIPTEVCHLNEGHPSFAVIERALSYMEEQH